MKQLEKIKNRLPPGINVRISSKNVLSFRVRFRKNGYPDQIKTFPDFELKFVLEMQGRCNKRTILTHTIESLDRLTHEV